MKHGKHLQEELELEELRATEQQLLKRQRESEEARQRLARERIEQERTMPPLEEVQVRERFNEHQRSLTRGEIGNLRRAERHNLGLLILLLATTATLVWWGLKLMHGG